MIGVIRQILRAGPCNQHADDGVAKASAQLARPALRGQCCRLLDRTIGAQPW